MKKSLVYLLSVSGVLMVLLGGCGGGSGSSSSSSITPSSLVSSIYFPLLAGSVYNYVDNSSQSSSTSTHRWNVQPQTTFQGQAAIPIVITNQQQTYTDYFTAVNGSVSLIGGKDTSGTYDLVGGSWLIIPANPTDQTWTFTELDSATNTSITNTLNVVGLGSVTVPAGSYSAALHIHDSFPLGTAQVTHDYWYAPNVGLVKDYEVQTAANGSVTTFTSVLSSFTPGG